MDLIKKEFFRQFLCYFTITLTGFLLYFKILSFDLTFLDDNVWLYDYHWFLKDLKNASQLFTSPDLLSGVFYRPVLNLSFMLNAAMGGNQPLVYHLTNIILHVMNGCLLFHLLRKMDYSRPLALGFALILVVHPVLTQAVAWIPGRTDSLLAVFTLASFILYIHFLKTNSGISFILHLCFLAVALLVKETAIAIPLMCFLYAWLILKQEKVFGRQLINIITWTVVISIWLIIRWLILVEAKQLSLALAVTSMFENSPAIISYIGKMFFPVNLSVLPVLEDMPLYYGFAAIAILLVLIIVSRRKRWNYILFGFLWFFVFLLPSLVISFLKHEYRLYLPMIGCMFILLELDILKDMSSRGRRALICFAAVIIVFFTTTFRHADRFKEKMAFWQSAVATSPHSPLAHRNLGAMYYLAGDMQGAELEYKKALELNPYEQMAHNNLGLIYVERGLAKEAEEEYLKEIAINPGYDNVHFNLGILYYKQGKTEEALALWKKTIELNPKYLTAYQNLFAHYVAKKDLMNARIYMRQLEQMGVPVPVQLKAALLQHL